MRIIKFRAWDEFNQEMVYENPGIFRGGRSSWEILRLYENVMQFTGLHDKNGKEIYECEILYNNDRKEHCIVKYSKEKAMFIVKYLESNDEFPLWESISNLYYSVGNIYENPELLEKKFSD